MRLRCVAAVLAVLSSATFASTLTLHAQQPLRVLRHMPADTVRPGDVVTISFSRPVAASLENAPDPSRLVRITPDVPAVVDWRDPATLRIVPRTPLEPGTRYRFVLSGELTPGDPGQSPAPYEFTLTTRGPAVLGSVPMLYLTAASTLEPNGRIRILYSAPVDSAQFARVVRLEVTRSPSCVRRTIPYRVSSQRALSDSDDGELRYVGWDADSAARQFRRVVELRPATPPQEACMGVIVLPSLDPSDRAEIRYPIATAPRFLLEAVQCDREDCASDRDLWIDFTAPVTREALAPRLHLTPSVPFTVADDGSQSQTRWRLQVAVEPGRTYRVRVDSTLTDIFGRRIGVRMSAALTVGDRHPSLGHQLGVFNVPRARPVLRLTHVNIDSAAVIIVRIPDSLRTTIVRLSADSDSVARIVSRLREVVVRRVALPNVRNVERITDFAIPASMLAPSGDGRFAPLLAVRARAIIPRVRDTNEVTVNASEPRPVVHASRVAIIQATDLITHAKVSDYWGAVLVTSASDGAPVRSARISTSDSGDRVISAGETDSTGVARLEPAAGRATVALQNPYRRMGYSYSATGVRLVEVVRGSDRALTAIPTVGAWNRQDGISQLGGALWPTGVTHASAFVDRGMYRPNEIVYLTTILRLGPQSALRLPSPGDSIRVRVALPQRGAAGGRMVRDTVLRVDAYGTVADSFRLGAAAALGTYEVSVDAFNGAWQYAGTTSFVVSEYRAPEFETSLKIDTGLRFIGDTVRARATGKYYFGPAMRGAVVRWTASLVESLNGIAIPGLPAGFAVGMSYAGGTMRPTRQSQQSGVDTLDANGETAIEIPTSTANAFPTIVALSVAATDANRQVIGAYGSAFVHSSNLYVAAHDSGEERWYWKTNEPRTFGLLTVRATGERIGGVRLRVTILRHHNRLGRMGGGQYPSGEWATDTVRIDSVTTGSTGTASYTYAPRDNEWHELVFSGQDERGHPFASSLGGFVLGSARSFGDDNPVRIAMRIDDVNPTVGDSLDVRFISPFTRAEAWVTVEREMVLLERRLLVRAGESVVRIPVLPEFFPGAQVGIVLVDSGSAWRADSLHKHMRAGYASIGVGQSTRRLDVTVQPSRREFAPADSAAITVTVRDHLAKPVRARVALWAVDEGVLALSWYAQPDPLTALHANTATALTFVSSAADLALRRRFLPAAADFELDEVSSMRKLSVDFSGSGAAGGTAYGSALNEAANISAVPRADFRTTAFYLSTLETDVGGNITASVKLPDNVTRYRVIAVAVAAGDSYGSGNSTLVVSKPLIARAALPRFVREGDSLVAGAVVNNHTGSRAATRISAAATGLRLLGTSAGTRTIANDSTSEVRFSWRTTAHVGETAVVRFRVDADTNADVVDTRVPVRAPYSPRFHTTSGIARDSATIRMMLPPDIDPRRSRLTLRVGNSPLPVIRAAYWQLEAYPYLCSEQLTSNGRVILAMLRMQRAGLADSTVAPTAKTLRARLQFVVDELSRRQGPDGRIGYWYASSWTIWWLDSYVGMLMLDAREAGIAVDSSVVSGLVRSVSARADTVVRTGGEYGTLAERRRLLALRLSDDLATLQFLRRAGVPNAAREDSLVKQATAMTWDDRVWLVDLLSRRTDKTLAREHLARAWRDVETAGVRADIPDSLLKTLGFPSHVRPVARLLVATLALEPNHPRLPALIERIAQQGRAQQSWRWNTQDVAWASEALAKLAVAEKATGAPPSMTVRSGLGGRSPRILLGASADSSR
ncbi:MAG TPA: alpha-2-macroglobulin family protein, partial [Gemmatimonadaceae bacterium]|nr:alpha-2-macroglobulin family protein [Gemmatimonadaceae bacterium]